MRQPSVLLSWLTGARRGAGRRTGEDDGGRAAPVGGDIERRRQYSTRGCAGSRRTKQSVGVRTWRQRRGRRPAREHRGSACTAEEGRRQLWLSRRSGGGASSQGEARTGQPSENALHRTNGPGRGPGTRRERAVRQSLGSPRHGHGPGRRAACSERSRASTGLERTPTTWFTGEVG